MPLNKHDLMEMKKILRGKKREEVERDSPVFNILILPSDFYFFNFFYRIDYNEKQSK